MATYFNESNGASIVGLTPNFPGKVIPLPLQSKGTGYRCKDGAYFASTGSVHVGYDFDCCTATCCFGGQGCVRQTVSGDGTAFLAAMGTLQTKRLDVGEVLIVDTHSLVAWEETVTMGIRQNANCCTCCCGGEGFFNTTLTGAPPVLCPPAPIPRVRVRARVRPARSRKAIR